jgi:predicted RNase H-like HicB family nuclease
MSGHTPWSEIKRQAAEGAPDRATADRLRYRVTAERDGRFWLLRVPELPGVFTQVRRLEQAPEMVRDAIALMLDVPADTFEVDVEPALEPELAALVASTQRMRDAATQMVHGSNTRLARTVHALVGEQQLTVRDAAALLDLSFQRVAQLAAEPAPTLDEAELARLEAASEQILREVLAPNLSPSA